MCEGIVPQDALVAWIYGVSTLATALHFQESITTGVPGAAVELVWVSVHRASVVVQLYLEHVQYWTTPSGDPYEYTKDGFMHVAPNTHTPQVAM